MNKNDLTRRQFIAAASAGSLAAVTSGTIPAYANFSKKAGKLAILGGEPVRKNKSWPGWPYCDKKVENSVLKTTKSGIWCRIQSTSGTVPTLEKKFAQLIGAKFCVATGSGTQALHTSVEALGIGPGDEVITSPYTDPGTISSILTARALPVLADLDRESYQLDPDDVEQKITQNTRAIMPVHMMGQPCDIGRIMEIAKKHNLKVIEDAAQAHLAEYKGKKLGTIGDLGCFSFQSSKTIACGEGGAITGNNEELMDKCYTVHNHGTSRRGRTEVAGPKYRMNEFEGAVLLGQWDGIQERFDRRNENADRLTYRLKDIPGMVPQKLYEGTTKGSFYIYAMTYQKEHFNNADRSKFLKALAAEGVSLSPYIANGLHKEPWVDHILNSNVYKKMYSRRRLQQYREQIDCPICDKVCRELAMVWASGPLLGTKGDMDDIADAIQKVYENRDKLNSI
ncbi:MAG: DegT/DnrJ/EryC1/StrS family aminotransferase [Sedimentisphaerales bacterium]|nr:DegT/DnrJ/EryC1/StrS family aminotransferase [Sedimentisphaerales bacterium]